MKRFTSIQKDSKLRKINEQELTLPQNTQEESGESQEQKVETTTSTTESSGSDKVVKFFSKLFESREMAHIYHLQVKGDMGSHAKHVALQEYYEGDEEGEGGILEPIDTLIEMYQAQFGIIENYDIIDTKETMTKDPIQYFEDLAKFIKTERSCFNEEDSHYFNIIDDILVLIYQLLYKLKFTK
jgi:hypothetical protein